MTMLLDYLIEVLEEKVEGKSCFIVMAAKHSSHEIHAAAQSRFSANMHVSGYTPMNALVEQIQSDKKSGNTTVALYSNKVDVLFFDESNRDEVFHRALANCVDWLMQLSVNRGRFAAYAKIRTMIELGDDRPYIGFSSFAATPTNKEAHKIIAKSIDTIVSSKELRSETIARVLDTEMNVGTLIECKTDTIEESKKTIEDFLCMGLFIVPIKTQNILETANWFNDNYAASIRVQPLTLAEEYAGLIDTFKASVLKLIKGVDVEGDIHNLNTLVSFEEYSSVTKALGDLVYNCSASDVLWLNMALKESNEVAA